MSDIFHKSCYTSRSSGYKYRTLSTNTGEKKRRTSREENTLDTKFRELQKDITSRVSRQIEGSQRARDAIRDNYHKINAKIDSILDFQNTVTNLRKQLHEADYTIVDIMNRVNRLYSGTSMTQSKQTSIQSPSTIFEEKEILSSAVTHV